MALAPILRHLDQPLQAAGITRSLVLLMTLLACSACRSPKEEQPAPQAEFVTAEQIAPEAPPFMVPASPAPWSVQADGITCEHPRVEPDCQEGWCRIPSGCFMMGSPETELWRGASTEDLVATTLTRPFLISSTEITQKQWSELVENNPAGTTRPDQREGFTTVSGTLGDDYPVDNVSWLEAIYFANALSRKEGFTECYTLESCEGSVGLKSNENEFTCEDVSLNAPTLYECEGYRLPTEAEWEYATRAGTRTAYFSGDISVEDELTFLNCTLEMEHLNAVAWHCGNSEARSQLAGSLLPNQWGLYDTHGNLDEWVHDERLSSPGAAPWVNPNGPIRTGPGDTNLRKIKGGAYAFSYSTHRAAGSGAFDWADKVNFIGFRLVRTLEN